MSYYSDMIRAIANPESSFKPLSQQGKSSKPASSTYGAQRARERNAAKLALTCCECGKQFKSAAISPHCPKCGSYDVDVR